MTKFQKFKSLKLNGHGLPSMLAMVSCSVLLLGGLGGCTSMSESPDVALQPSLTQGEKLSVEAKADSGLFSDTISLYVNKTKIGTGVVTMIQGSTKISGNYKGNSIEASCRAVDTNSSSGVHECQVYVNGSKAVTLHF